MVRFHGQSPLKSQPYYSDTNMPNIAGYLQYDIAGGHQFIVTGEVADWDPDEADTVRSPALVQLQTCEAGGVLP